MQDFDGNELQIGDTVIFYTTGYLRRKGGMHKGVIINIRGTFTNKNYGIADIANINTPGLTLEEAGNDLIYLIDTAYRGSHPTHLRELFPYQPKEVDDSYPSW